MVLNTDDDVKCKEKCYNNINCTHFVFNPNNNGLIDVDTRSIASYNEFDENDPKETSSFGFNGTCILKSGTVSKADAEYYKNIEHKHLVCGIKNGTKKAGMKKN